MQAETSISSDYLFLVVLPYLSLIVFFFVSIRRYLLQTFTYSSLSSQFLENQQHFWAVVPFHYGIIFLFFGHLTAFLIPRQVLLWNSVPFRLYILEIVAFVFGVLALVGLISILIRRITDPKIKLVTSFADWIILSLFLVQIFTGLYTAVFHGWGSSWFAATLTPYLWSVIKLNPDISYVIAMPLMVKLHIIGAYVMIALFPFTRLVHVLVVPNPYLWRKPQVVRWYGIQKPPSN